jgi:uncharacterized protein YhaN
MLTGLGAGLNIVYAPNRAGKSTLALAYRLLIGDDLRKYRSAEIAASWTDGTSDIDAIVVSGLKRETPVPAALPMRYVLDLPEMVGGLSEKDKEATELAIAGNVRIPDDRSVTKGLKAGGDSLRKANKILRDIESDAKSLEDKRKRINTLDDLIDQASSAGNDSRWMRVAQLQQQISLIDAQNTGVERQSDDATTRLDQHLTDLSQAEDDVEAAKQKLDSVAPSAGQRAPRLLRESDNASIATLLTRYDQALADHRQVAGELSEIEGPLDFAIQQLATGIEPDEVVPSAARFADQADRSRAAKCEREAYGNAAAAAMARQEEEKAERVILESPERPRRVLLDLLTSPAKRLAPSVGIIVLLGLGAVAALLAALVAFINSMAVLALGVISAVLVVIALVLLHSTTGTAPNKGAVGDPGKPEALLDEWTDLVRKLEQSSASERAWNYVGAWFQGKTDTSPSTDETDVEATWNHWKGTAGLDANATPYHLAMLFDRWQKVQELRLRATSLESQDSQRLKDATEAGDEIRTILGQYNWACGLGSNLADEVNSFRKWFDLSEALAKAENEWKKNQERINTYLNINGIPDGELLARSSVMRDRAPVAEDRRNLASRLKGELHELDSASVDHALIKTATERWCKNEKNDLPAGIELARDASAQLDNFREERNGLDAEIRVFEQSSRVAEARSNYDRSLAELMGNCEIAQSNAVWNTLLNSVREHVVREAAPELLAAANAKLERVDAALVLRIAPPELDATKEELGLLLIDDQKNGRSGQRFSELATSTKVNAVLAIRLALIKTSEQGIAYPIFADELMAVADESTRKGIARLLVAESADRQVIVLTNQAEDAHALLEEAGENAAVLTIGGAEPSLPKEIPMPPLPAYLVPLGPVEPDFERDVAAHAPGFMFVEQSDLAAVGDAPTIAAALEQLTGERKADLKPMLEALHEIHRYVATTMRRIRVNDIEKQEWVTKTYQDEIYRILNETGGDPEQFRKRVASIKGYRDNNKNALDQFLMTNGFLGVPKPRFEDLVQRARAALGDLPDATRTAQWCAMRYLAFCETQEDS